MFSSRLKELREEKGWSQKDLAEKIKSTNKNIWAYENGIAYPNIDTLIRMSKVFQVSVDFIIGNTDDFGNVIVSAPNGSISPADEKLLKDFYALGPFEQEYIRGQIQALLNTSREVIKK